MKEEKLGHHTHVCVECGSDWSPYWQSCQRCGSIRTPARKDQEVVCEGYQVNSERRRKALNLTPATPAEPPKPMELLPVTPAKESAL